MDKRPIDEMSNRTGGITMAADFDVRLNVESLATPTE